LIFVRLSRSDEKLIVLKDLLNVEFSTDIANVTFDAEGLDLTPKSNELTPKSG